MVDMNDGEKLEGLSLPLLRCCPLVQHLRMTGWIHSLLDNIHTTITTFTGLRHLSIHTHFVTNYNHYNGSDPTKLCAFLSP